MFLTKAELDTVSTDEIINRIINGQDVLVAEIINENIDLMKTYLHEYYDVDAIFNATGNNRSLTLLMHLKSMVIYSVYKRRSKAMNEVVKEAKDEALLWLEKVATGKVKPNLPLKPVDTDGDGVNDGTATFMKLGSRKKYENRF